MKFINLHDLLKMAGHECEERDYTKWTAVSKMSPEDMLKHKAFIRDSQKFRGELEVMEARMKAKVCELEALHNEFWNHLTESRSLPQGDFHLGEDGTIYMRPGSDKDSE